MTPSPRSNRAAGSVTLAVLLGVVGGPLAPVEVRAQRRDGLTVQVYLGLHPVQQRIYLERLAATQRDVVEACAAELSTEGLRRYVDGWIADHPGLLDRQAVLAFTAALLDRCGGRGAEPDGGPTKLTRLEAGGWTAVPYWSGEMLIDVYNDRVVASEVPGARVNDLFNETNLSMLGFFSRQLYLELAFSHEPVGGAATGNRTFATHGVFVGGAALTWDRGSYWVSAGKGKAHFGLASNLAPGIWGSDPANERLAVKGRVGVAANRHVHAGRAGTHAVYGGAFVLDTSSLSRTFMADGPRNRRADGGPSNTGRLNSFVVASDGGGLPGLGGLRYHVAAMHQAVDHVNGDDGRPLPVTAVASEQRLAAALHWPGLAVGDAATVTPLVEYVRFWNARGLAGRREDWWTASVEVAIGRWSWAFATTRWRTASSAATRRDWQWQLSGGYYVGRGVTADAGYRWLGVQDVASHTVGIGLGWELPIGG